MTIKMLMGEQFQPLGAPLKRNGPEKPNPITAFERGNHAGPGGEPRPQAEWRMRPGATRRDSLLASAEGKAMYERTHQWFCMPRHEREAGAAPSLPWWMIVAAIGEDAAATRIREQIARLLRLQGGSLGIGI